MKLYLDSAESPTRHCILLPDIDTRLYYIHLRYLYQMTSSPCGVQQYTIQVTRHVHAGPGKVEGALPGHSRLL